MDRLLEKVKARISQQGSPIRTVRGVAEALDMSESGFYRMVERGNLKRPKIIALAKALDVKESYFGESADLLEDSYVDNGQSPLEGIVNELKVLREQLQVKDRQIEKLLDLLGKPEGAPDEPHSPEVARFEAMVQQYKLEAWKRIVAPSLSPFVNAAQPVAMLVAPR